MEGYSGRVTRRTRALIFGTVSKFGLNILQLMVVARYSSPSTFGYLAIALAIITLSQIIINFGFKETFIIRKKISRVQISSMFWLSTILSLVIAIAIIFVSNFAIKNTELTPFLYVTSGIIILNSLYQIQLANFEKNFLHDKATKIEVVALFSGVMLSLYCAMRGYEAISILYGMVCTSSVMNIGLWCSPNSRSVSMEMKISSIGSIAKKSSKILASNLLVSLTFYMDILIAGFIQPSTQLGLYANAKDINFRIQRVFNPIASRQLLPSAARLTKKAGSNGQLLLNTLEDLCFYCAPIYVSLAVTSNQFLPILFGEQWAAAAPIFSCLSAWGLFRSVSNQLSVCLMGSDRVGTLFLFNASTALWYIVTIPLIINLGFFSLALYLASANGLFLLILLFLCDTGHKNKILKPILISISKPILISVLIHIVLILFSYQNKVIFSENKIVNLFMIYLLFSSVYLLASSVFNKKPMNRFVKLILNISRGR